MNRVLNITRLRLADLVESPAQKRVRQLESFVKLVLIKSEQDLGPNDLEALRGEALRLLGERTS